ncbi:hypothetical protein [Yeosuana sp. AK3]
MKTPVKDPTKIFCSIEAFFNLVKPSQLQEMQRLCIDAYIRENIKNPHNLEQIQDFVYLANSQNHFITELKEQWYSYNKNTELGD